MLKGRLGRSQGCGGKASRHCDPRAMGRPPSVTLPPVRSLERGPKGFNGLLRGRDRDRRRIASRRSTFGWRSGRMILGRSSLHLLSGRVARAGGGSVPTMDFRRTLRYPAVGPRLFPFVSGVARVGGGFCADYGFSSNAPVSCCRAASFSVRSGRGQGGWRVLCRRWIFVERSGILLSGRVSFLPFRGGAARAGGGFCGMSDGQLRRHLG